ncbi:MAG: TDP-N-acetylfucosamine:lipid II N-acetylfucosaminyltransferase [Lachnospiraceae bacterium]|nr:TDP-N-acetylfucosamine:lipid II N-acetylfucosaminyltransferase [Lachnospiraceae bacterium]
MILHIFNKQEKFSVYYIKFLKDCGFDMKRHVVFHYGKSSGKLLKEHKKVMFSSFVSPVKHIKLYKMMKKSDKIIIHSLASPVLLLMLMFHMKVTEKFYWVIWGKDLYFTQCMNMKNPLLKLYEGVRKKALKNIKHIITNVEADYNLAVEWYKMDAELILAKGMSYPYNSDVNEEVEIVFKEKLNTVLLGNSASVSNHHLEALDLLKANDNKKMTITCPLSYGGSEKYVEKVVKKGKELFGDRFIPVKDFMPLEEYNQMINGLDIAFFYHDRQEAFSNTLTLLGSGKKIYIRPCSTLWDYFQSKGIKVHNSEVEDPNFFVSDDYSVLLENKNKVAQIRDPQLSKECWMEVFEK